MWQLGTHATLRSQRVSSWQVFTAASSQRKCEVIKTQSKKCLLNVCPRQKSQTNNNYTIVQTYQACSLPRSLLYCQAKKQCQPPYEETNCPVEKLCIWIYNFVFQKTLLLLHLSLRPN